MSRTKTIAVLAGATLGLGQWATAQDADQNRAYQAELMRDTDARSSYAQGDMAPMFWGQIQVRYTANIRSEEPTGEESFTHGFSNRRTKLGAKGGNDEWSYKVNGAFSSGDGIFDLEDAYVDYMLNDQWDLRFGQFKLPLFYEESMSSSKMLAADRSLANEFANQDRSQGIMGTWDNGDNFRGQLALSDGAQTANTDYNSIGEADYAFTGRIDWKDGDWADLEDFTSELNGNQALRIGGFGHWQDGGSTGASGGATDEVQVLVAGIDGQWESNGWNAFGSVAWISTDPDAGEKTDDLAVVLQGGWRFDETGEVFVRGSYVALDDRPGDPDDLIEILIGYNRYMDGHNAKFTLDAGYFPFENADGPASRNTAVGLEPDTDSGQIAVRAQFQLLF